MDDSHHLEETVSIILRPYLPDEDAAILYSTWRNNAFYSSIKPPEEDNDTYFRSLTQKIRKILKTAQVRVACQEDHPSFIVGYSVVTGTHLNWIYVKSDYRNQGIGTLLFPKTIQTVTDQLTKIGSEIVQKKKLTLQGDEDDSKRRKADV